MKGQLTIEYMITTVAFIGLMVFVYFQYASNIPDFINEIRKENIRSKVYQLSELLLNDPGYPEDWVIGSVERIGLSHETYNKSSLLSLGKITSLNSMCLSDYLEVQRLLSFDQAFFIHFYNITDTGGRQSLLDCSPPTALVETTQLNTTARRITSFVDTSGRRNFGELVIWV